MLDILEEESFTITYEIANIKDISNSGGSYTKSLSIPNTKNNRNIFAYVSDMAVDLGYNYYYNNPNSFNPNKKVKCFVLENSVKILEGYIQFTDFDINTIENNDFLNVTIYADNANFYIAMGDSLLTDLDFGGYSFTFSQAAIQNSWTSSGLPYYFPLIDYGHGWTLDDLNNPTLYQLGVKDFKPAVSVKTILDKIFATYSYNYSSNFLRNDSRFTNLIIPYSQQNFQTGSTFSQDKIFHVGLTTSTIGQFTDFNMNVYQAIGSTFSGITPAIFNMATHSGFGGAFENVKRYAWYDGYLMSPFQQYFDRNTHFNDTDTTWTFDQVVIPFALTASPMFETFDSSGNPSYNTGPATPDFNYQNRSGITFKQRFVLNTDIVTNYSNQWNHDVGSIPHNPFGQSFDYIIKVAFYREFDMSVGPTTSGAWLGGTGIQIPADLGGLSGAINLCHDTTGATDSVSHWVSDINNKSNVFDKNGTLIVPLGSSRYLGKYCTNYLGDTCLEPGGATAAYYFDYHSGDAIAWYYNDSFNQTIPQVGMWVSGYNSPEMDYTVEATYQPAYGDWYQQLQCQTIYLDNNSTDPLYGAAGSIMVNGNIPIQPTEKVRCIVFFGGKYHGQQSTSRTSYKPPTSGTLLTSTSFLNDPPYPYGRYQHPATQLDVNGNLTNAPLTYFYNDVSNDYIEGQRISFNDIIPKNIKQRDFVQDIVRLHNLYIEPSKDTPNTLIIEPREDYYNLSTTSLDWSTKIDLTQPINVQVLAETQNKRTTFTYKADNDFYNKLYTQNTNQIYSQFINQIDNDYLTGQTKIESLFSPTPLSSLFSYFGDIGGDSLTSKGAFVLPVLVNGANVNPSSNTNATGAVQTNYRLLYKNYISNQNADTITMFGVPTHYYPYAGPYDNPYTPSYTVNWGQTLGEFYDAATDQFTANLVNTYWAGLLTEMTDIDSRIVTCYMWLTSRDINNFHFYNLVFVTIKGVDGYYKVNSIEDYVPGKNSLCKVTLLRSNTFLTPNTYSGSIG